VGAKVMDIVADDVFLADVNRKAALMRQKLEGLVAAHPDVFDSVRGSGLMLGLKCKATNTDVVSAGYAQGVLTVPAADNVVRLLPALNIPDEDIGRAAEKLDTAASHVKEANA
jgi:acetylornithine/N-succinyldiaminopimelate aminotransferase